jgi:hypothetical protein
VVVVVAAGQAERSPEREPADVAAVAVELPA